jgi:hypothetical protein
MFPELIVMAVTRFVFTNSGTHVIDSIGSTRRNTAVGAVSFTKNEMNSLFGSELA